MGTSVAIGAAFSSMVAVFIVYIWLLLYGLSALLLKAARRLDIGLAFFNHLVDIDKKPLLSIGLVAGVLVAVAYWLSLIILKLL